MGFTLSSFDHRGCESTFQRDEIVNVEEDRGVYLRTQAVSTAGGAREESRALDDAGGVDSLFGSRRVAGA